MEGGHMGWRVATWDGGWPHEMEGGHMRWRVVT